MSSDSQSLAHTSWNCKYHIVFAPKYRRKEFYGLKRLEIGAILRNRLREDRAAVRLSIDFDGDPFDG